MMTHPDLHITLFQFPIKWENKEANLQKVERTLKAIAGKSDLLVLPEMFSTGFSMNAKSLAEPSDGMTMRKLTEWASVYHIAIAGSYIASDGKKFYNRGFFITPQQETFFYDKRHLFSIGTENETFSAGTHKTIVSYKGWNICLLICYDLRFPVWARNKENEYDLLIYVANWPASRISGWNTLLPARAIENSAYVCAVNRTGEDGVQLKYNGHSYVFDMKGKSIGNLEQTMEGILTVDLSLEALTDFRKKFPVWKDADSFEIEN